jgi:hypothetical protein
VNIDFLRREKNYQASELMTFVSATSYPVAVTL